MTAAVTKRLLVAMTLLGLILTAGVAAAASQDGADNNKLPAVLEKAVKANKVKIDKTFKTDVPGLTGYVVKQGGQYQILYGQHGYLFVGSVISPDGENLSAKYTDEYVPKPDVSKVVAQLEKTGHLVQQGQDGAPLIYAFVDPNCIYCHVFYERAKPLIKAGKLQVKLALVGFLKPSSMGRAAAILSADDPAQAWTKNEEGFNKSTEDGAIDPVKSPSDELKDIMNAHFKAMTAAGGDGTPTLLFKEDGHWKAKVGAPSKSWLQHFVNQQG